MRYLTAPGLLAILATLWMGRIAVAATTAISPNCETICGIVYAQPGGYALRAEIYRPTGAGPFPTVLCVHGGAWALGNRYQMALIAQRLASHGYAAVSIDYRLAPQYLFPAQLDDCRAAWAWMRANGPAYKLDTRRLGAWGYSAGAQLVTLMAFEASLPAATDTDGRKPTIDPRPRAVIAGGTPIDFRQLPLDNHTLAFWLGGSRREKPQAYEAASPAQFVSAAAPPIFFYHGDSDSLAAIAPVKSLEHQLEAFKIPTAMYVVPGAGHIRAFLDPAALDRAIAFLDQRLK